MDPGFSDDDWGEIDLAPPAGWFTPRLQRLLAAGIAVAMFAGIGLLTARAGFSAHGRGVLPADLRGSAIGVQVIEPGHAPQNTDAAHPVAGGQQSADALDAQYRYPADGSLVTVQQINLHSALDQHRSTSLSKASFGTISVLNGHIQLTNVHLRARAYLPGGRASGGITLGSGASVVIDGVTRPITANRVISVQGVGTITIDEQAVVANVPTGDDQTGPRYRITGAALHLRLDHALDGLPAGSEVVVGELDAGVRRGRLHAAHSGSSYVPPESPSPSPSVLGTIGGPGTGSEPIQLQAGGPKPGTTTIPRRTADVRSTASEPAASLKGYVFPVLGESNFTDTFGGFRADIPQGHQGNDIFAREGTPIVAVADGVLDRVGWNPIGGYRFWLFDKYGNGFYHAHLSAYAPIAVDGAHVHAGDVIGFVGHTGDAQGTPNHLHFEVHPHNGPAIDPYPFLIAARHGQPVPISSLRTVTGTDAAALPPLTLLSFSDISANSGLEPGVLDHVPDVTARGIDQESAPVASDDSLASALNGGGIDAAPGE
jgi:hypothetical protein